MSAENDTASLAESDVALLRRIRGRALSAFLGFGWLNGVSAYLFRNQGNVLDLVGLALLLATVVSIVVWCNCDAQIHRTRDPLLLRISIWLFALVAVPIHLGRSRGWKRSARILFGLPVFAAHFGLISLGEFAAERLGPQLGV